MYHKIYFKHGTMFSGKSLNLISTAKTYEYNKNNVLIIKPVKDTRDPGVIKSRMSNEELDCITIKECDCKNIVSFIESYPKKIDVILIDEVQFFPVEAIDELINVSKIAPVICYGLKTSYTGELFPAIVKLLAIAEDVQEIKTVCRHCCKKATHNLLLRNGKPIYNGDIINVEGENINEEYQQVCRYHFYNPVLGANND